MSPSEKTVEVAPKAWKGWRHLQGAINVGLTTSIRKAHKRNEATLRALRK